MTADGRQPYTVLIKPVGPVCNLECKYCFYLEKKQLYPDHESFRMSPEVLEAFVRQYVESQPAAEVPFAWQGGEPTLLGISFFQRVVELQKRYANGKVITNAMQTNGTLLNDEWCEFLTESRFLVGLSIDGPRELHDCYRVDGCQRPTFDAVMRGLDLLKKHGTEFNTLTVVSRANSPRPLEVYRFLKDLGSGFMQFIPLVERNPDKKAEAIGLGLGLPPVPREMERGPPVTPWSVRPSDFGEFYVRIFDEWVRQDVGKNFVQLFDVALGNWMGIGSRLCNFAERCGQAVVIEHNGDLYSCDHYVYPKYRLGNILGKTLGGMANSAEQSRFGRDKCDALPNYCLECNVRFACNGGCPKHRFLRTPDGEPGLNYLCSAYQRIFAHVDPYMRAMAQLVRSGRPADLVMQCAAG